MERVGALVLAAGSARRFGADKRRYSLEGVPLLAHCLTTLQATGLPVRLCLRAGEAGLLAELDLAGPEVLECPRADRGMGATLADGVGYCRDWDGLLVVLGDMPWIAAETYRAVAGKLSRDSIVQPVFEGRGGHPVGFGADFFPELVTLDGDRGARTVLERHPAALRRLEVADPGIHRDLDEPPK